MTDWNVETYRLDLGVVGTTFDGRQKNLSAIKDKERKETVKYKLIRDKDNRFDKNAVRVVAVDKDDNEYDLGFISKDDNKGIAFALDNNSPCYVYNHIFVGGHNKKNHGLIVSVEYDIEHNKKLITKETITKNFKKTKEA